MLSVSASQQNTTIRDKVELVRCSYDVLSILNVKLTSSSCVCCCGNVYFGVVNAGLQRKQNPARPQVYPDSQMQNTSKPGGS